MFEINLTDFIIHIVSFLYCNHKCKLQWREGWDERCTLTLIRIYDCYTNFIFLACDVACFILLEIFIRNGPTTQEFGTYYFRLDIESFFFSWNSFVIVTHYICRVAVPAQVSYPYSFSFVCWTQYEIFTFQCGQELGKLEVLHKTNENCMF